MSAPDFLSRAIEEGRRYGGDRYVFVRELAQNARDAGATRIDVSVAYTDGQVEVVFRDNGAGMTFSHAREYLFALYASSKEREAACAGRFGVGFWAVLLFEPNLIQIDSKSAQGKGFSVHLSGDLAEERREPCGLSRRGTQIRMVRRAESREGLKECAEIEKALKRHCSHLRQKRGNGTPLAVHLNGLRIDKPFSVDGPCWMAFRDRGVEGAVGLGPRPRVEVYAQGLLVFRGTAITELEYGANLVPETTHPLGLSPVYVLNGDSLQVTMDRRAVVDDAALKRLRRIAERRMRELLSTYLDTVARKPWPIRFVDGMRAIAERCRAPLALWVLAVTAMVALVGGGALLTLETLEPMDTSPIPFSRTVGESVSTARPAVHRPLGAASAYIGPSVHSGDEAGTLALAYTPPISLFLRTAAVETLDPGRGAVAQAAEAVGPADEYVCAVDCVRVRVAVDAGLGPLAIPVPTGYAVDPRTVRLDGRTAGPLYVTAAGEPVLKSVAAPLRGVLEYDCGPTNEPLSPSRERALSTLPKEMDLPESLASIAREALGRATAEERADFVAKRVRAVVAYDTSVEIAERHRQFLAAAPARGWLRFVEAERRGDCDVANTVAVALLRAAKLPSRLAVGYPGEAGVARPGMHAWIEYHDGVRFRAADATATAPTSTSTTGMPLETVTSSPGVEPPRTLVSSAPNPRATTPPPSRGASEASRGPVPTFPASFGFAWDGNVALAVGVVSAAALLVLLALLVFRRGDRLLTVPKSEADRQFVAAQMLLSAFSSPDVWLEGSALDRRPLLPILGAGTPISMAEAKRLAARRALWFSTGKSGLAKRAAASGSRILSTFAPVVGEIAARIPGAQDLDAVAALDPKDADALPEDLRAAGRVVEEASRLLAAAGGGADLLRCCPGLEGPLVREIDLSALSLTPTPDMPLRFIAVSLSHPIVVEIAEKKSHRLPLAGFLLLDVLLAECGTLAPRARLLREKAAAAALEGASA